MLRHVEYPDYACNRGLCRGWASVLDRCWTSVDRHWPTVDGPLPTGFIRDVTAICSRTIKLPNSVMINFTDHNYQQALLTRHLMSQMDIPYQTLTDGHPVSSSIRAQPHHALAP